MKTLDERISTLFDEYDKRQKHIDQQYDWHWQNAITAEEILSINEWHDKEKEKLAIWWRKSLRELSAQMGYSNE